MKLLIFTILFSTNFAHAKYYVRAKKVKIINFSLDDNNYQNIPAHFLIRAKRLCELKAIRDLAVISLREGIKGRELKYISPCIWSKKGKSSWSISNRGKIYLLAD
jgi:hypothetical protein